MNPILCPGENPTFLLFDFSTRPQLLFYTYIPAIVIALFLGFFVYIRDKSLIGKLLFFVTLFFALWVLDILILWVASYNDFLYLGWQLTPIFEIPLFIFSAYLTLVFTQKEHKDIHPLIKICFLTLVCIIFLLIPTKYNIMSYNIANCEGTPGVLFWYMYVGEILTILLLFIICLVRFFQSSKNNSFQKEIFYFGVSIIAFLILFTGSNIIGQITEIQQISFIGSLGMVVFLGGLVFLIVKFKAFNIKLVATEALIWCLAALIGSQFFFIKNSINFALNTINFISILIFGHFLIKSVKKEIEQRQRIEKLATDLENVNNKLKELDRQKDAVLHMVAHQFKGPVATINFTTELLLDGTYGELSADQKEHINTIRTASQKMGSQSEMVLDAAKITAGKLPLEPKQVDLNMLLKEVVNEAENHAKERNVNLKVVLPNSALPAVILDPKYTQLTFDNLLSNAIKYTALKSQGGDVYFNVEVKNNALFVIVKDTGIGIPKKDQEHIFKELFRASNSGKEGTGLGLHVAVGAIEAQGGKIWFESEENKGTTFFVELPLKLATT